MTTSILKKDLQDTLQEAALHFLRRHKDEHLRGEQELFSRAVEHLVVTFAAQQALAENIVARAYGELNVPEAGRYLDMTNSTANAAIVVDPQSGRHFVIPVNLIFQHLIDSPARRKLAAVKG